MSTDEGRQDEGARAFQPFSLDPMYPIYFIEEKNGYFYYAGSCCDYADPHSELIASQVELSAGPCAVIPPLPPNTGNLLLPAQLQAAAPAGPRNPNSMRATRQLVNAPSQVRVIDILEPPGSAGDPTESRRVDHLGYYRFAGNSAAVTQWIDELEADGKSVFERRRIGCAEVSQDGTFRHEPIAFCYDLFTPVDDQDEVDELSVGRLERSTCGKIAWIRIKQQYGLNPAEFDDDCLVTWN